MPILDITQSSDRYFSFVGRARDINRRLKSLQTANPYELKVIEIIKVKERKAARELENSLHQKFNHLKLSGEWFKAELELFDFIENKLDKEFRE